MLPMTAPARVPLPPPLAAHVWRGSALGHADMPVQRSGWAQLDAELPGGGWPCGSLNEILTPQAPLLEWRLLAPALREALRAGAPLVAVGPPAMPYLPGLHAQGVRAEHLVWVRSRDVGESLWAAGQVLRAGTAAALLVWLPACRTEALRRLHAHAQGGRSLVFALRPAQACAEASAAPLRVQARVGEPWELCVRVFKRRGPSHEHELRLRALPGALDGALSAALAALPPRREAGEPCHAVGRVAGLRLA